MNRTNKTKDVIVTLQNGSITVSAYIYERLNKKFVDLTKCTVLDVLNAVTELTKTI